MFHPTQSWPGTRPGFCAIFRQIWRIPMSVASSIPFLDLVTPHLEMEQELTGVFRKALHTAGFIGGTMVEEFESSFAEFCGVDYAIAVSSGTDALRFALIACGILRGDVVVTVP